MAAHPSISATLCGGARDRNIQRDGRHDNHCALLTECPIQSRRKISIKLFFCGGDRSLDSVWRVCSRTADRMRYTQEFKPTRMVRRPSRRLKSQPYVSDFKAAKPRPRQLSGQEGVLGRMQERTRERHCQQRRGDDRRALGKVGSSPDDGSKRFQRKQVLSVTALERQSAHPDLPGVRHRIANTEFEPRAVSPLGALPPSPIMSLPRDRAFRYFVWAQTDPLPNERAPCARPDCSLESTF